MNAVFEEVIKSKKYSNIDRSIVMRICEEALHKYPKKKEVIKAAKKQLHIIHESFLMTDCYKVAYSILEDEKESIILKGLSKDTSVRIMGLHASTKERIATIEETYNWLSEYIDTESTVIDVGCGFNSFAIPFIINKPKRYYAYDISNESAELLNHYFSISKSTDYKAMILDATVDTPPENADVLLAFKLLPLLQQQKKGRAFSFLEEALFHKAIISFPIKSLSGKEKGMLEFYTRFFEEGLPQGLDIIEKKVINNELFYVISK